MSDKSIEIRVQLITKHFFHGKQSLIINLCETRITGQTTPQPYLSPSSLNPGPNSPTTPALTSAPPITSSAAPRSPVRAHLQRRRGRGQRGRRGRKSRMNPRVHYARLRLIMQRQQFQKFYRSSIRASHRSGSLERRVGRNRRPPNGNRRNAHRSRGQRARNFSQ